MSDRYNEKNIEENRKNDIAKKEQNAQILTDEEQKMVPECKSKKLDMLHGSIWNKLPRYALPVAATAILEQLFNASDLAVVGNFSTISSCAWSDIHNIIGCKHSILIMFNDNN